MKYLKPLMLVIAGFAIAMLVSFKNEEPKKEYATIYNYYNESVIFMPNGTEKRVAFKSNEFHKSINNLLNELANDNWVIKNTISSSSYNMNTIYLERTKQ